MYIILAIIAFGILIIVHELGHFMAAKSFGVKVVEFSVGMGPRLLKKQGKETLYSLRALPVGGSCLMEGEDEETPDPRAFTAQKRWKRFIILFAGAFMNLLLGAIVVLVLVTQVKGFVGTTITELVDGFPSFGASSLEVGDRIASINGEKLYYSDDFSTFLSLAKGAPVDIVVERDGKMLDLGKVPLAKHDYVVDGVTVNRYGVTFNQIPATAGEKVKYAGYTTMNFVRLIKVSIGMLVNGSAGVKDLSSPIGIVSAVNQVGQSKDLTTGEKLYNIAYFFSFIAVNLAVFNLLPIPALDGGRIFFMLVSYLIEKIIRRKLDPKYEGYVHAAGFVLLMGLMLVVMVNDVARLFHG